MAEAQHCVDLNILEMSTDGQDEAVELRNLLKAEDAEIVELRSLNIQQQKGLVVVLLISFSPPFLFMTRLAILLCMI